MVNFVVCQDSDLEFLAKAKPLRPRPGYCKARAKATKFGLKAKAND